MGKGELSSMLVREIGNALSIPGTNIGLGFLTSLQDRIDAEEDRRKVFAELDALRRDVQTILGELRRIKPDVTDEEVDLATLRVAEAVYLRGVARRYLYADFKGIQQLERIISLELDEIFVNLKLRPELEGTAKLDRLQEEIAPELEEHLAELDARRLMAKRPEAEPYAIDRALAKPGALVLLGGPGSGKTTLTKRVARSLALGPEIAQQRFPELPWCFPVVVPVSVLDDRRGEREMLAFLGDEREREGGGALREVFYRRWEEGRCLVLFDGLDEVADAGRRIASARAVERFCRELGSNRVLVTSRPVGYSLCRISEPGTRHAVLQPFEPQDVETFVKKWHVAFDAALHPESPDPRRAEKDGLDLLADIRRHPRVESLASNPLMLTIIALIRRQNVTLPEKRVELYNLALETLISSWNKARGLADRAVGEELSPAKTKQVWSAVAYWMHREKSTGTCHRDELQERVVEILEEMGTPAYLATETAESYISSAAEVSGLLEERGANVFAFMHQTFQEYLAARHMWLAKPQKEALARILEISEDPRWHEVVRLAAGFIGVVQENEEKATELVLALAHDERDPLEPYVCGSLRLAASCLADNVGAEPQAADEVVVRICSRIEQAGFGPLTTGLAASLEAIRHVVPGSAAIEGLSKLLGHSNWKVRMEAVRMLARAASPRKPEIEKVLRECLANDTDPDVKAHAAMGLRRAGDLDAAVSRSILYGLSSSTAAMPPEPELTPALIELLADKDADVRVSAASTLGQWGTDPTTARTNLARFFLRTRSKRWSPISPTDGREPHCPRRRSRVCWRRRSAPTSTTRLGKRVCAKSSTTGCGGRRTRPRDSCASES